MASPGFKTVFIRVRGRVIPIRKSLGGSPDEEQKIQHIKRAMASLRDEPSIEGPNIKRKFHATFFKIAKQQSKETGDLIAKRIARIKRSKK